MSLRRTLILAFAALLTVAGALAAIFSYVSARSEVWDMLDAQQRQIANFIGDGAAITLPDSRLSSDEADEAFVVEVLFKDGKPPRRSHPDVILPQTITPDYSMFSNQDGDWRLFTLIKENRVVRVAQRLEARDELAAESALGAALPFLFAIPLSWVMVTWLVGTIIRKLTKVAKEVDQRAANDTSAISLDGVPLEIKPLVGAMNRAFSRSQAALEQQNSFLANAAHELRTPLAAVSLQIGNLKKAVKDPALADRVADLDAGMQRATKLTDQLLRLARQDAGERPPMLEEVALESVIVEVMSGLMPLAKSRDVDLGAITLQPVKLVSDKADLHVLAETIIDNAVRYSAKGGKVDLALSATGETATLTVTDTGPGINKPDMPKVFDRFFRAASQDQQGSGLGLSIAKMIADRHGFKLKLVNRSDRSGLVVTLTFAKSSKL